MLGLKQTDEDLVIDEFHDIKTVPDLFRALKKYVFWFNYDFVVELVQIFLRDNQALKRMWLAYEKN